MSKQETYELIEAYHSGNLTETELAEFQERLANDPMFADQVALLENIDNAISDKSVLSFQELVQSEGETYRAAKEEGQIRIKRFISPNRLLAIAASIVVLIGAFLILKNQFFQAPTGGELFAKYYKAYDLNESIRSGSSDVNPDFQLGIQQYQAKNFSAAVGTFQKLANIREQDMALMFSLAQAQLNLQPPQYELAEQSLLIITQEGNSVYVPAANWYLSLIFLKRGERAQAKGFLNKLGGTSGEYGEIAKALLKEMGD